MTERICEEVVESKVTKTEMIDMVLFEREKVIKDKIVALEEGVKRIGLFTLYDFNNLRKEIVLKYFKAKFPKVYRMFWKEGDLSVISTPEKGYINNAGISVLLPNDYNGTCRDTQTFLHSCVQVAVTGKNHRGCIIFETNKIPELKALYKRVEKDDKKVKIQKDKILELRKELNKIVNSSREIKIHLTRALLDSTVEGKQMLKRLNKVDGKVFASALI